MADCLLNMEFEADFRNVDTARSALQKICDNCFGAGSERATDIIMAANEAMNNAVEHTGSATVTVEATWDGNVLSIFVTSGGPPFDPVAAAAVLNQEDMLERDEGGYGLYLIRELVDSFEYEYRDARNTWILRKHVGQHQADGRD